MDLKMLCRVCNVWLYNKSKLVRHQKTAAHKLKVAAQKSQSPGSAEPMETDLNVVLKIPCEKCNSAFVRYLLV